MTRPQASVSLPEVSGFWLAEAGVRGPHGRQQSLRGC